MPALPLHVPDATHDRWKRSVVYQIYPRSFCDSDGDGVGDLRGIISKLDYLKTLGADVIWLSPVYASPNDDNGYDISDYRAILPEFGTMADFDALLAGLHERGMRLMMDLVANHTSDEHDWFRQARQSRDSPYHDYYIWAEPEQGRQPTNWESFFGGSAWEWNEATGEYFLHLFSRRQPDLNWENPRVRHEVHALMRFWLDKGVDGFRMDVINLISKHWTPDGRLPDAPVTRPGFLQSGFELSVNGPRLMEFLREMRAQVLDQHDCLTVGECPGITPEQASELTDPNTGALNMVFQFDHMSLDALPGHSKWDLKPLDLVEFKQTLSRWQTTLAQRGWNSLYLGNHDQPRAVSRFGCDHEAHRVRCAKMLALCLHGMQGTPYVFQGEELAMTNFPFETIAQCQDIETLNMYRQAVHERGEPVETVMTAIRAKGRDNARTPMQWHGGAGAGFTQGHPWLAIHPNHRTVHAEQALDDPDSAFHFYRRLIALRRELPVLVHGSYELLWPAHQQVFGYRRTLDDVQLLIVCNFSAQDLSVQTSLANPNQAECLLHNVEPPPRWVSPDGGAVLHLRAFEALMLRVRAR